MATEDHPDEDILHRLEYLRENTHAKLNLPIAMTELIILTNLSRGLGRPIEYKDNNNKTVEMDLGRIIKYAKDSYFELAQIVIKIAYPAIRISTSPVRSVSTPTPGPKMHTVQNHRTLKSTTDQIETGD